MVDAASNLVLNKSSLQRKPTQPSVAMSQITVSAPGEYQIHPQGLLPGTLFTSGMTSTPPGKTTYPIRTVSQNLSTRDRKSAHTPTEDPFRHPPGNQAAAYESKSCQLSNLCLSSLLKEKEIVEAIKHTRGTYEALASEVTQNGLAVTAPSTAKPVPKADGFPLFSGAPKDQTAVPRQHTTFTGRLGQPPRGPISLHMYSRKNVFLHHNLHTAELQTLGQQDG